MADQLIGIDCASKEAKIGLARGTLSDGRLRIDHVMVCSAQNSPAVTITEWVNGHKGRTLLAIDAPLGWPDGMGRLLSTHRAGDVIAADPNTLFRRETDRFIKDKLGKTPLDVGADRIARTAHAALRLLDELRRTISAPLPLVWDPAYAEDIGVIEVYPAATLVRYMLPSKGYKESEKRAERKKILKGLRRLAAFPVDKSPMEDRADALDAALCVIAGRDFLAGHAMRPEDHQLAEREGWIWAGPCPETPDARRPDL